jgi:predicted GNAT family acetyltransferase
MPPAAGYQQCCLRARMGRMALTTKTAPDQIRPRVDALVRADPVRGTILGTISRSLGVGAWCAHADGASALAVRSSALTPLVVAGEWGPADLASLADLLLELTDLAAVSGPTALVGPLAATLASRRADAGMQEMAQRLFRLDTLTAPTDVPGSARRAEAADRPTVLGFYVAFAAEAGVDEAGLEQSVDARLADGGCWLWMHDGTAVSMASRHGPIAGSSRVGPVYTPPEHRGRGFGSAATAAATGDVLADGAIPVLFTDLANPVSNRIYPPLGYYPVEDRLFVRFS